MDFAPYWFMSPISIILAVTAMFNGTAGMAAACIIFTSGLLARPVNISFDVMEAVK